MNIPTDSNRAGIIASLMEHWGNSSKAEIAQQLGVSRPSLSNYESRTGADIQTKIILELMRDIDYLEKKLSA